MGQVSMMEDAEERFLENTCSANKNDNGRVVGVSVEKASKPSYEHWDKKDLATLGNLIDVIERGDTQYQSKDDGKSLQKLIGLQKLISEQIRQNNEKSQKIIEGLYKKQQGDEVLFSTIKKEQKSIPEQIRQGNEKSQKIIEGLDKKQQSDEVLFSAIKKEQKSISEQIRQNSEKYQKLNNEKYQKLIGGLDKNLQEYQFLFSAIKKGQIITFSLLFLLLLSNLALWFF